MTTRPGGFPRIKRPDPAPAVVPTVETKATPGPASAPAEAEYDEDDRRIMTGPLAPPPRPKPTIFHPQPVQKVAPPPVRPPGSGLLASRLPPKPGILPPARHAYPESFPRTKPAATQLSVPTGEAQSAILQLPPERPRVPNNAPKFDKDGGPLGPPRVALKRHVAPQPLSPEDVPF
jgi:hypothetical protein